jgi:GTPase Era involved in 16S rRNA processing
VRVDHGAQIGTASRLEIEQLVGRRVHLILNVSVKEP